MSAEQKYAESFAKLIKCPTVTDSGDEYFKAFHAVLEQEFPHVFATCEKIELGRNLLLLKWKGLSSDRPVMLMAHQDVVPASGDWKYPPFDAVIENGVMYGRGTIDCKNTLFGTIKAVDELIEAGFIPAQDIYLSYSDCEETSGPGAEMSRDWFKKQGIRLNVVIDEGGALVGGLGDYMAKDVVMVGILEKGYADVRFVARGKGGHSSQPPKNSPIARLGALVNYCEHHRIFKPKMSEAASEMLYGLGGALKPSLAFLAKTASKLGCVTATLAPKIIPSYGNPMFATTMVFTMMEGATAPNIIPQEAWVNANLRFSPNDKPEDCFKKLEKIAKKFDVDMEVRRYREASPMADLSGDGYTQFVDAIKKVYPDVAVAPYLMFGGTDCRTMQEISNTAIRCTPCRMSAEQLSKMHAANENINVSALSDTVKFFRTFLEAYK